jgi:deoxyribose-phosphate aldolase
MASEIAPVEIAKYIDHTNLKSTATKADIIKLCVEAKEYGFASVCVQSCYAELAAKKLSGSDVKVCCTIGFPLGTNSTESKAFEAEDAVNRGAKEIDMVVNVGAVKDADWEYVKSDIRAVREAIGGNGILKVIIEACLLTDEEKIMACRTAAEAGAEFVKTSTGFSTGGATEHDVKLMRETVGQRLGVKAAGGIRNFEQAVKMIEAGASRIGASAGIDIVKGK